MNNFWTQLPTPFTVLAPMDGVTDVVFREIITEIGKPDVFFTEFVNVEGLNSAGREKVSEKLRFGKREHPVVAQIWGVDVESYKEAAKYCRELGFDGIDINMGCPDRTVIKNGACSALIKNPELAKKIIEAVRSGAGELPVSVKTRIGFSSIDLTWIEFLLKQKLPALTVHLRTVSELSTPAAHWELMTEIIEMRNNISPSTLIVGNGDIKTLKEIEEKYLEYKCEGFMVGRGIFSNPWFFNKAVDIDKVTVEERIELFEKHIKLFEEIFPDKNPAFLKKFCKTYMQNFPDATTLRDKIMACNSTEEMRTLLKAYS